MAVYEGSWWELSNGDTIYCDTALLSIVEFASYNHSDCKVNYNNSIWTGAGFKGPDHNGFAKGLIDEDYLVELNESGELIYKRIMNTPFVDDLNETTWEVSSEYLVYGEMDEYSSSRQVEKTLLAFA